MIDYNFYAYGWIWMGRFAHIANIFMAFWLDPSTSKNQAVYFGSFPTVSLTTRCIFENKTKMKSKNIFRKFMFFFNVFTVYLKTIKLCFGLSSSNIKCYTQNNAKYWNGFHFYHFLAISVRIKNVYTEQYKRQLLIWNVNCACCVVILYLFLDWFLSWKQKYNWQTLSNRLIKLLLNIISKQTIKLKYTNYFCLLWPLDFEIILKFVVIQRLQMNDDDV